jgi:phospholipid/cholesterol/gamma-HCH transport system permease protein
MAASVYSPPGLRWARQTHDRRAAVATPVENLGFVLTFVWHAIVAIPQAIGHYRTHTIRLISDMTWGRGSLLVGGGTAPMLALLGAAMGASLGVQAFSTLDMLGMGPVTGMISAFANTRELAPIAAGIGFAAQAGCRITAEIGSMRISEEIDALEALGIRSIPFAVTTRLVAGVVSLVPTFLIALILSYFACATVIVVLHGQAEGVYGHYFDQFASGGDIMAAVLKIMVFGAAIVLIHCYYGYFASGGPEGVGRASGRAVRASFVSIIALNMVLTVILWGANSPVTFTG